MSSLSWREIARRPAARRRRVARLSSRIFHLVYGQRPTVPLFGRRRERAMDDVTHLRLIAAISLRGASARSTFEIRTWSRGTAGLHRAFYSAFYCVQCGADQCSLPLILSFAHPLVLSFAFSHSSPVFPRASTLLLRSSSLLWPPLFSL